jgi:hypothetical protein
MDYLNPYQPYRPQLATTWLPALPEALGDSVSRGLWVLGRRSRSHPRCGFARARSCAPGLMPVQPARPFGGRP